MSGHSFNTTRKTIFHGAKEKPQVVESPQEIKIHGNFTRVFIEGNDLYQTLVFEKKSSGASFENCKLSDKKYMIVPIKDKDSVMHFVKFPIFKLKKKPTAKKVETLNCQRLTLKGVPNTEELNIWSAEKSEIVLDDEPYTERIKKKPIETFSKETQCSRESMNEPDKINKSSTSNERSSQEKKENDEKNEIPLIQWSKSYKETLNRVDSDTELKKVNEIPEVSEYENRNPQPIPPEDKEKSGNLPQNIMPHFVTTVDPSKPKPKKKFTFKKLK